MLIDSIMAFAQVDLPDSMTRQRSLGQSVAKEKVCFLLLPLEMIGHIPKKNSKGFGFGPADDHNRILA